MATTLTRSDVDVQSLDSYAFVAVLGKGVIHPGGRRCVLVAGVKPSVQ